MQSSRDAASAARVRAFHDMAEKAWQQNLKTSLIPAVADQNPYARWWRDRGIVVQGSGLGTVATCVESSERVISDVAK